MLYFLIVFLIFGRFYVLNAPQNLLITCCYDTYLPSNINIKGKKKNYQASSLGYLASGMSGQHTRQCRIRNCL
ncbi:hypothetical protein ES319_A01G005800v1 [Gossypium barbadense]|uniref:Secreted protein n=1 Tax=Gossypium barbadense TaxID=3634 RepID=A0A5J5WQJ1_GOSBA|nr:hypothetical protein ES319_A01G005800v1 [Gossypium barbadense]